MGAESVFASAYRYGWLSVYCCQWISASFAILSLAHESEIFVDDDGDDDDHAVMAADSPNDVRLADFVLDDAAAAVAAAAETDEFGGGA